MPLTTDTVSPAPLEATDAPSEFLPGAGIPGLVSVVIPTYNRAEVMRGSIDSVLAQTHAAVEVILVDDGSRDGTRAVAESYDSRVRYVHQDNAGVSAARNRGFAHARGEFIALLDSDDEYLPWKLAAQVAVLRRFPEVGMVWTDMSAVDERGTLLQARYLRTFYDAHEAAQLETVFDRPGTLGELCPDAPEPVRGAPVYTGEIFSQMLLGNLVHTSTVVLRRDRLRAVGHFDVTLRESGEDYEFHLRTCSLGPVAFIDVPTLRYRVGAADQLTAPHLGIYRAKNNLTTVLRWLERGGDRVRLPRRQLRQRLGQAYGWVGESELEYGDRRLAAPNLWKSLTYVPWQPRTTALLLVSLIPGNALDVARRIKRLLVGPRSVTSS